MSLFNIDRMLRASSTDRTQDNHTLIILVSSATADQIRAAVNRAITEISRSIPLTVADKEYELNIVTAKFDMKDRNDSTKFVFRKGDIHKIILWVRSEKLFFALMNLDEDGMKRVAFREDPNWTPPDSRMEERIFGAPYTKVVNGEDVSKSWWELVEEEEDIRLEYERPVIELEVEPLYSGLWYTPSREQMREQQQREAKKEEERKRETDDDRLKSLKLAKETIQTGFYDRDMNRQYFTTRRFIAKTDNNSSGSDVSGLVPDWVTINDILIKFSKFSSTKGTWKDIETRREHPYPIVKFGNPMTITDRNTHTKENVKPAYIVYTQGTHDGIFALEILRAATFQKNGSTFQSAFKQTPVGHDDREDRRRPPQQRQPPPSISRGSMGIGMGRSSPPAFGTAHQQQRGGSPKRTSSPKPTGGFATARSGGGRQQKRK